MSAHRIAHDPDAETTRGYIYTHLDCPHCGEVCEVEGDAGGDTIQCDACGGHVRIREVF